MSDQPTDIAGFEPAVPDHQRAEATPSGDDEAAALVVHLDGYEGPLDMLLGLARDQKVDLARISILALAEQYLAFIGEARRLKIELAADWLVMAAWLAYLKSRLLLPRDEQAPDEPSGEEMAAALAFQLRRLEAMREAAAGLFARPQFGRDTLARGAPEGVRVVTRPVWEATLFELLQAYGAISRRGKPQTLRIERSELYSLEDALARLVRALGGLGEWSSLWALLPDVADAGLRGRSALASTLLASLELARTGQLELRQERGFGPVWVRRRATPRSDSA